MNWSDSKVIDFVNWYLKLHKFDARYELENQNIIDSFKNGDDYKLWWNKKINKDTMNLNTPTNEELKLIIISDTSIEEAEKILEEFDPKEFDFYRGHLFQKYNKNEEVTLSYVGDFSINLTKFIPFAHKRGLMFVMVSKEF